MKFIKGFNKKRALLILIAFVIFLLAMVSLIPLVTGMGVGYDSAMIEAKVKKQCQCKSVKSIKTETNSEIFVEGIKNLKPLNNFAMQLSACNYASIEDLKTNVLNVLIENNICEERNIQFIVEDFKDKERRFVISNCNINNN